MGISCHVGPVSTREEPAKCAVQLPTSFPSDRTAGGPRAFDRTLGQPARFIDTEIAACGDDDGETGYADCLAHEIIDCATLAVIE
jgi:hypothetical protein